MKGGPRQERGGLAWDGVLSCSTSGCSRPKRRGSPPAGHLREAAAGQCPGGWWPVTGPPRGWIGLALAGSHWTGLLPGWGPTLSNSSHHPSPTAASRVRGPANRQPAADPQSTHSRPAAASWRLVQARYLTSPRRLIFDRPCHRSAKRCVFSDASPGLNADCPLFRLAADQRAMRLQEGQTQDRLVLCVSKPRARNWCGQFWTWHLLVMSQGPCMRSGAEGLCPVKPPKTY
jgi:hypothetical protein